MRDWMYIGSAPCPVKERFEKKIQPKLDEFAVKLLAQLNIESVELKSNKLVLSEVKKLGRTLYTLFLKELLEIEKTDLGIWQERYKEGNLTLIKIRDILLDAGIVSDDTKNEQDY